MSYRSGIGIRWSGGVWTGLLTGMHCQRLAQAVGTGAMTRSRWLLLLPLRAAGYAVRPQSSR